MIRSFDAGLASARATVTAPKAREAQVSLVRTPHAGSSILTRTSPPFALPRVDADITVRAKQENNGVADRKDIIERPTPYGLAMDTRRLGLLATISRGVAL